MAINNSFIVKNYNISKDYSAYNAWKSKESFSYENEERICSNEFVIKEYIFEGLNGNRDEFVFKNKIKVFTEEIISLLFNEKRAFMFVIEPSAKPISKLRSYKKYLRIEDKENVIEKEYFDDAYSRFASIIKVNKSNYFELMAYFFNSNYSFVYTTNDDSKVVDECFLDKIVAIVNSKHYSHINLYDVVINLSDNSSKVFRIGGNDGEEYWSLQEFYVIK